MNGVEREGESPRGSMGISTVRYFGQRHFEFHNIVAVEEPLEIYVDNNRMYMTMRSPGEEIPLALGYCFAEGIIDSMEDIASLNNRGEGAKNRVDLFLAPHRKMGNAHVWKNSVAVSKSGVRGERIIKDTAALLPKRRVEFSMGIDKIVLLHEMLDGRQNMFRATGNTHAACIFDSSGEILSFSEDTGRHNALDKAIGLLVAEQKIDDARVVILTSRLSYGMVRKVARLNVEILMGISAATSLAIDLARAVSLTLIGFSRRDNGTIYTCPERVRFDAPEWRQDRRCGDESISISCG